MEFQRIILFTGLGLVLLMLWQNWEAYQREKSEPATVATPADRGESAIPSAPVAPATTSSEGSGEVPQAPSAVTTETPSPQPVMAAGLESAQKIIVETDLIRVEIDTFGGDLRRVDLLQHPVSVDTPDQPFALLKDDGIDIFVGQSGLIGAAGQFPNHQTVYRADADQYRLEGGDDTLEVPLHWSSSDGVSYRKIFVFGRDSYQIQTRYEVDNQSGSVWQGFLYAQFLRTQVIEDNGGLFFMQALPSYKGGAIYTPEEHYEKIGFDDMFEQALQRVADSGWVAMLQHYFVGAWVPAPGGSYEFYSRVDKKSGAPRYNIGYKTLLPENIAPGATGSLSALMYAGPKEQDRLVQPAESLVLTVDYGWLTPVSSPLFAVLRFIHGIVGNWGWSIILLTLLIKLLFYPLSAASYKSMAKMKQLQPRLQTLRERFGDDKQKLNQAMMEMYKKDKINPLGGCLPIVIQIPVFIALYWVLLESVELRQANFALWLKDLSLPDPFYVLPILMGASMFAQQLLNPAPLDPVQKNIMMALPVVFTVFFLWFPAGLVLYWLVNNILSIAQQWHITRNLQAKTAKSG
ncbi:MAG: membrane protein insertase YidC [Gammaproteobacteria bacterium]|nr:membrane protein insertase YidC [Gammaproteobacteria bacterium]